ncbi:MAG: hypothetical protein QXG03_13865 [Halalkalicoccus sp.]
MGTGVVGGVAGCSATSTRWSPAGGDRGDERVESRATEAVLRKPPFPPADADLFAREIYERSGPMRPAAWRPTVEPQIRGRLRALLDRRFREDPDRVRSAMAVYDDADLVETIPDPRLRAGAVAMAGTVAQPAFEAVRDGALERVRFEAFEPGDDAIAVARHPHGRDHVGINDRYRFEDFRLFTPTVFHEVLHEDGENSPTEELIIHSLDSLLRGQLFLETPDLAIVGTELARWANTVVMARINSRDERGDLRLFESQDEIFPGGAPFENYADVTVGHPGHDTPGNEVLRRVVETVTGRSAPDARYDDDTLALLDAHQELFDPGDIVRIAAALALETD